MHASCSQTHARGEGVLRAGEGQPTSQAAGWSRDDPSTPGLEEAQQAGCWWAPREATNCSRHTLTAA